MNRKKLTVLTILAIVYLSLSSILAARSKYANVCTRDRRNVLTLNVHDRYGNLIPIARTEGVGTEAETSRVDAQPGDIIAACFANTSFSAWTHTFTGDKPTIVYQSGGIALVEGKAGATIEDAYQLSLHTARKTSWQTVTGVVRLVN